MPSASTSRFGTIGPRVALSAVAIAALALAACSKTTPDAAAGNTPVAMDTPAANDAMAPEAPAPAGAPAADNTDTLDGTKLASFTGDATKGALAFVACKTCHMTDANMIGPMLKGVVGRKAATVAGFTYSDAMKNSGITWTPEKLFQYLEKPQRVVPGTRMTYPGLADPQKRADVIAYLKTAP